MQHVCQCPRLPHCDLVRSNGSFLVHQLCYAVYSRAALAGLCCAVIVYLVLLGATIVHSGPCSTLQAKAEPAYLHKLR